jgi:hypothetical protein
VRQLHDVFTALGIEREAMAAVYLLVEACEREKLTAELVSAVALFLT